MDQRARDSHNLGFQAHFHCSFGSWSVDPGDLPSKAKDKVAGFLFVRSEDTKLKEKAAITNLHSATKSDGNSSEGVRTTIIHSSV
jgi:hypothetical protein